jgi:hypothetical protein
MAIEKARSYCEWTKKIREKTRRIDNNSRGIMEDINQLDDHLKLSLKEIQALINKAVMQITANAKEIVSTS